MILSNQVHCEECGGEPFSAYRWDFKYCKCGNIAVDGGMDYLKRSGGSKGVTDMSIVISGEDYIGLLDAITDDSKNNLGKMCNLARYLRDEMGINIGNGGGR